MDLDLRIFGERLRAARHAHHLTQQELADLLGAPRSWVSDLENNHQRGLEANTLMRFARALEVSADYLLGLTDAPETLDDVPRERRTQPSRVGPLLGGGGRSMRREAGG